jgi:hypothetical protein
MIRLWWILLLGVAACSPYNYSKEVSAFDAGVTSLSDGFNAGYTALATNRLTEVKLELINTRSRVDISHGCNHDFIQTKKPAADQVADADQATDDSCTLYRHGGAPSEPSANEIALKNELNASTGAKKALEAVVAYSKALDAVTKASDRTDFNAAVTKLSSAVGAIPGAIGPQGAAAGKVVSAALNAIGWVVGTKLDNDRFDSLKEAVNRVGTSPDGKPTPMQVLTIDIGAGLAALGEARLNTLEAELGDAYRMLGPSLTDAAYQQRLNDAEALASSIQTLRENDPNAAAIQMNIAHEALVKAVNDPSRNLPTLMTEMEQFSDQMKTVEAALKADVAPTAKPVATPTTAKPAAAKKGT